jgi:DNA-binding transcriptional regulator PaaX
MEIPRQKKTVRVAVTRPSVKKGAIVDRAQNRRNGARLHDKLQHVIAAKVWHFLVACFSNKTFLTTPFLRCNSR